MDERRERGNHLTTEWLWVTAPQILTKCFFLFFTKKERKKERKRRKEKGGLFLCKCSILWIHLTLTWLKEAAFEVLYSFPIFNYLKIIYLSFLFLVNFRAFVNLFKMVSTIPEQEESRFIVEVVVVVIVVYFNNYLKHNCSSCHKKEHS